MSGDVVSAAGGMSRMSGAVPPVAGAMSRMSEALSPAAGGMSRMSEALPPVAGGMSRMGEAPSPAAGGMSRMGEALPPAAGGMSRMTGDMSPESAPTPRMAGDMPLFTESLPLFKRDNGFHRPQLGFPSPAMPLWNNATWNAPGTFWGPAQPPGDASATPPIPATVPVAPGALNRIFDFVQVIKRSPGYTDAIGQDLGIVGSEDTTVHTAPDYNLVTEMGTGCQCVKVRFKKYGHYAVAIYSKRGGTDWELLGIDSASPYEDDRPLLVAGQPEIREYRLRFWDAGSENGEWSSILSVTVSV